MATVDFPERVLFGVPIHAVTRAEAIAACDDVIAADEYALIGIVNTAKLVRVQKQKLLREAVLEADLVLADGMGVVWASRVLLRPLPERVTGIDMFLDLVALAAKRGYSTYFFGAKQDVLDTCIHRLCEEHPELRVAGSRNGYFDESEVPAIASEIRASGADILFVGITSPFKEMFLARYGADLGVKVCHGVGGSFDVVAGKVKRAPRMWQRLGLEWLHRTIQEPRRMWKRYLVTNSVFGWMLVREIARCLVMSSSNDESEGKGVV